MADSMGQLLLNLTKARAEIANAKTLLADDQDSAVRLHRQGLEMAGYDEAKTDTVAQSTRRIYATTEEALITFLGEVDVLIARTRNISTAVAEFDRQRENERRRLAL